MSLPCGCDPSLEGGYGDDGMSGRYSMEWCPLHAKAPEVLAALAAVVMQCDDRSRGVTKNSPVLRAARALLRS